MTVSDMFSEFIENLAITNGATISLRYGELTAALNKKFRDTESKTANTLQVGSFGRNTGINGISDLDILYFMPKSKWEVYKDNKQRKLLQDVKDAIIARYPSTVVKVDRVVVTVTYTDFHVEVQPVFEEDDGSYTFPDTKGEGNWRTTKPREEMEEISKIDDAKNANLKRLCKMARAWKNKHGLGIGGLLIDTLAQLPDQEYYAAPGSGQRVRVKKKFQKRAKKAHCLSLEAIDAEKTTGVNLKWKKIYGRPFPANKEAVEESFAAKTANSWNDTEEFIEDKFPVDIRYTLQLDCAVKQNGFRENLLREMLRCRFPLRANKQLRFWN